MFSAIGTLGLMADAFRVAEKIPKDLNSRDAVNQWLPFMLRIEGAEAHDWFMIKPVRQKRFAAKTKKH